MSLYHKYRPKTFDEMVGNEQTISSLQALLAQKDHPHVYLFHGPTGCGKTTLARIIANVAEVHELDYKEIDSADFRGIEMVRAIRRQVQCAPTGGDYRFWVIDECHKMTNDAQNALLKTLEGTPSHVYIILCTTEPQKLLKTIRGRCSQFQVSPLNDRQMTKLIRTVVRAEEETITKVVYEQIIQDSLGHPRNALQVLEQVLAVPEEQRLEVARKTAEEQSQSIELCRALIKRESWGVVSKILRGMKDQDPESIRRHVLGYCNAVLIKTDNEGAAMVMEQFLEPFYNTGWPGLTYACYVALK